MRTAWTCPVCGGSSVGRVGQNQYFCRDCFLEFSPTKDGYRVYEVKDDGSLSAWEDGISG
ncbi:MAG: hypothetical protein PWQ41_1969 [Bacillota bacterium]|nr:hypothetical protein [Bacillota bacterium]MDK2960241.1 hypothetical protein [Bacillota bacterium]